MRLKRQKSLFSAVTLGAILGFFSIFQISTAYAQNQQGNTDFKSWEQLSEGVYVFGSAGAAFIDQKIGSRVPKSGTISFSTNDKDKASFIATTGVGLHMHRYFAFEVGYSYFTGAEYRGTISASNANLSNYVIDGSPDYVEDIYGHMITMGLAGTTYDLHDGIGLGLRVGAVLYDLTDEMRLSGSGTLNGNSVSGGNSKIKINDSGVSWTAGATVFIVPSIHDRFELRANYMNALEIDTFNKLNVTTAEISYRRRF